MQEMMDGFNDDDNNNFNFSPNINHQTPNFHNNIRPPAQAHLMRKIHSNENKYFIYSFKKLKRTLHYK